MRLPIGKGERMKAAVYYETGAPDVFKYEDVADPQLQPNGLLIDVKAVSIEGGDTLNRGGGEMTSRPHIVGYQCAGVIREVGADAQGFSAGQAVVATMASGSHASVVSVPSFVAWPVPEGLSIEEAATVPVPFGTADDALFEFGRLESGQSALIQAGASGVGIAAIQLAKRAGATVYATASSNERLERLKDFGLDHGINYRTEDFVKKVHELSGGKGVDVVLDSVGGKTLRGSIECLGYRGRAVSIGQAGRDPDMGIDPHLLFARNSSLTGLALTVEFILQGQRVHQMIAGHLDAIARGELKVAIDRTYPLSEAAEAHRYIESRQAFGRVLLIP